MDRFTACFSDLPDPRAHNALHDLTELLFIALLATLCGAKNCSDMADFAGVKEQFLRSFLTLEHGTPSHDTFSRVFRMLDPAAFEQSFQRFMAAFAEVTRLEGVVALDGKALRRAYLRGKSHMPPIMVTAWGVETRMALANMLAPDNNEAAGALHLVGLLQLKGCVVTADALHCHRTMARGILARGGDYALAVKGNQPALLRDAKAAFKVAPKSEPATTRDARHGRRETRIAHIASAPEMAQKHDFPGLTAVARITSRRDREKAVERYFLLSQKYQPDQILRIVRDHWGIENGLHWALDVVLDEDLARSRKDHAPANLAVLRRLALNIARAHPDTKTSLRRKFIRAGWDQSLLLDMLNYMR